MAVPPGLTQFSPIFPVADLRSALAHYQALGFVTLAYEGGDDYGFADRDGVGLHLAADPDHAGAGAAYLYVEDADAVCAEWSRPEVGGRTGPVHATPYRLREGSHHDPDGNLIRFGSPDAEVGAAALRDHLEHRYQAGVTAVSELDRGVYRVDRADGPSWVARHFAPPRSADAVAGDADIVRWLAEHDFPAERCATHRPVSRLGPGAVVVTEYVTPVPRQQRRELIVEEGGLAALGQLLGRLANLPETAGAPARPGGAWHHLADGAPGAEVAAATAILAAALADRPADERAGGQGLLDALAAVDSGEGLPVGFVHPDFVLANVVASAERGLVLVDWAGAGRGPRLWPLAWLLFTEGGKDLRRVDRLLAGYRQHVTLEPEELARLAAVAPARRLSLLAWSVAAGRTTARQAAGQLPACRQLAEAVAERAAAYG